MRRSGATLSAAVAWMLVAVASLGLVTPASADGPESMSLTVPDQVEVDSVLEVRIDSPNNAVAIEAVLVFDRSALEFGGAYFTDVDTHVLTATNQPGWIDVGGYRCELTDCDDRQIGPIGPMTVRFSVLTAGSHSIRLTSGLAVDANGAVLVGGAEAESIITATEPVRPDEAALAEGEPPGAPWPATNGETPTPLGADRRPVQREDAEVTLDGQVDRSDVVDVGLGWVDARRQGDPCVGGNGRLDRLDVDGSGCLDVADVVAVAANRSGPRNRLGNRAAAPAAAAAAADVAAQAAPRPPMVVNSTSDEWDHQLSNEICDTASGVCSLRAALHQANWNPGPDTIHFDIPGPGPHRIDLGEQLYITDTSGGVTIDGFTQPGASPNTDPLISNASIRIELRGQGHRRGTNGIVITSADNVIRGLAVYGSFSNIRLTGANVTGNLLVGNHIGTNATATAEDTSSVRDQAGVEIVDGASYNRIGTPDLGDRNVISGNPYSGIRINHAATTGNIVQNNLIGLTPTGTNSLYTSVAGVDVQFGAKETLIGGYQEHAGNVVTGVSNYGIDLSHSSKNNIVVGNRLGTNASGTRVLSHSPNLIGLAIKDDSTGNTIEYNVMGGNRWHGVWHRHNLTGPNTFRYNRIGIGLDGSNIGNDRDGIYLSGHDDTYEGNLIAYNGDEGISVQNYLGGNYFAGPPQYTERNRITANSIFDNNAAGIDILSGHNGIGRPTISSAVAGSAQGSACGGCTVELYLADGGEGRRYVATTVASSGGSWTINSGAIADADLVALAIKPNGDTSEFSGSVRVGSVGGNSPSSLAAIGDRTVGQGQWDEVTPSVSNPDNDHLVFHAYGLPLGMAIDRFTGRMYGRPSTSGTHRVIVAVDDGGSLVQQTFRWSVVSGNAQASIGDQVSYVDGSPAQGVGIDLFTENRTAYITSTATDGSGSYRFDVSPGCYVLTFVAPENSTFDTGQFKNVDVCVDPAESENGIDVVLIPAGGGGTAVGGQIEDQGGTPQADILVDLFSAAADGSRDGYLRSARTAADGSYRFDLASGGCFVVVLVAPQGGTFTSGSRWAQLGSCVDQGSLDLDLNATLVGGGQPGGTVAGAVTTAAGGAPPPMTVDLFAAGADGSRTQWLSSTTTDGAGGYSFSTGAACHVVVFIAPTGFTFQGGSIYREGFGCTAAGETVTINAQLG